MVAQSSPRRFLLLLSGVCALLSASCSRPGADERPNLILVLVDTLRADHLGAYGHARDTSPNVDAFARGALLFTSSRSQASSTFPSVNSILTSRSPSLFLGQPGQALGIPAEIPTVATILRENGYRTTAVSTSPIVRNTPHRLNPTGGFGRGFDSFEEECLWEPAPCVNRLALKHLRREDGRPFFLYLHYIDPHDPYRPPRSHRSHFQFARRAASAKRFIRRGETGPIAEMLYGGKPDPGVTPADLQHLVDLYDEEIAYFDRQFAQLLAALREAELLDNSILVFTSDHGEEFLEHGDIRHGRNLFDTTIRTPLILHVPGVEPRAIDAPVQNMDIVPTLLDYAGIGAARFQLEGRSLRPLIEGRQDGPPRRQVASQVSFRSVSDGNFKLIHDLRQGGYWLYDLAADPQEKQNILDRERRSFHDLRGTLTAWITRTEGDQTAESVRQGDEAQARLKALGYLQ